MFKVLTPLMPQTMGRYAYRLWFTPPRLKVHGQEQIVAQKAKARFITVDGLKIRLWSWGEGPTILFIHGWGGRGTQISSFVDVLTNAGFNVMSFDMPAHGQSEGKHTNAFSIAKSTVEVIKHIDNLHSVITHSFGGAIFGYFYQPQLALKNIVLICPPATLHTALNQFSSTLQLPQAMHTYIDKSLKKEFGEDVFNRLSLMSNGPKITQPVLIVHDNEDDVVPIQDGRDITSVLQQGSLYETNELGHRKILFDRSVVERITQFLLRSH